MHLFSIPKKTIITFNEADEHDITLFELFTKDHKLIDKWEGHNSKVQGYRNSCMYVQFNGSPAGSSTGNPAYAALVNAGSLAYPSTYRSQWSSIGGTTHVLSSSSFVATANTTSNDSIPAQIQSVTTITNNSGLDFTPTYCVLSHTQYGSGPDLIDYINAYQAFTTKLVNTSYLSITYWNLNF